MRKLAIVTFAVLGLVLLLQSGSKAAPRTQLVSPVLAINSDQRLECNVVNTDDSPHTVLIAFFDSNGAAVSGNPAQVVPAHGSFGLSFPFGFGANHCEITADGHAESYRASIDILDTTAVNQPHVLVALPIQ
jgi:hypothetical protein